VDSDGLTGYAPVVDSGPHGTFHTLLPYMSFGSAILLLAIFADVAQ